jgi:hypothetical protein
VKVSRSGSRSGSTELEAPRTPSRGDRSFRVFDPLQLRGAARSGSTSERYF